MTKAKQSRWLTHPLTLVAVPALATILVAVISVRSKSETPEPNRHPVNKSAGGVTYRVDRDVRVSADGWRAAFGGPLPNTAQLGEKASYTAIYEWAAARGAIDVGTAHLRLYLQNDGAERGPCEVSRPR